MKQSAGLLPYRRRGDKIEVFLGHPGGPFWAKKDSWSITKGEVVDGEELLVAMRREFIEETAIQPPADDMLTLGSAKSSGKTNHIWAAEFDIDLAGVRCDSMASVDWPPRSGEIMTFPENDKYAWMTLTKAARKIFKSQIVFIERLAEQLGVGFDEPAIPDKPANPTLF